MKKHVLIAAGLAVLSTSAFATKARMEALGQGTDRGSFLLEDNRNIFRNASKVNSMKNYVITEWGTGVNTGVDSNAAPVAEGGFFKEAGSFAYGLYFGSDVNSNNADRNTQNTNYLAADNALSLFLAGDAGVEWGVRFNYASNKSEDTTAFEKKQSSMGLGLGVTAGDLEAWANLDLKDDSEGATAAGDKFEADLGMTLGASYKVAGMTAFAEYAKTGWEETDTTDTTFKPKEEVTDITVGAGKVYDHGNGARSFCTIAYTNNKEEDTTSATAKTETTTSRLPVTVGFEADATTWLTLRGSISQPVIINSTETKTSTSTTKTTGANATDVNAGATLNFGKLKVDGSVGTLSTTNAAAENGVLHTDNLMTRVAVHYWF